MSFASFDFLFQFLPFALAVVLIAERINRERLVLPALILVSAVFYGLGSVPHLLLLLSMIAVSWSVSWLYVNSQSWLVRRLCLLCGVTVNLLALTIWKYGNSIVETWNVIGFARVENLSIIMPLGISFYAFQQIGYLLDLRRGKANWMRPIDYLAFILFFPQLIAGPIVTEKRMRREFAQAKIGHTLERRLELAVLGVAWLSMGLFKKVVLADGIGRIVQPMIEQAAFGNVSSVEALIIGLAAPTRVYFDFCGYSDMAVGLALLFGIKLPANFNAPYRAKTTRQFWPRWHMTFHHFVRDHLYGPMMRATQHWRFGASLSLMVAVALSSLWHGNTVQFLIWGLVVWVSIVVTGAMFSFLPMLVRRVLMVGFTIPLVLTMGVLFTTPDLDTAVRILSRIAIPSDFVTTISWQMAGFLAVMVLALIFVRNEISTQVLLEAGADHRERHIFGWRPPVFAVTLPWVLFIGALMFVSFRYIGLSPPFVYFGI